MNREELRNCFGEEICKQCTDTNGHRWGGILGDLCEGSYCDSAEDDFANDNDIELED